MNYTRRNSTETTLFETTFLNSLHTELEKTNSDVGDGRWLRIATQYRDQYVAKTVPVAAAIVAVAKTATPQLDETWNPIVEYALTSRLATPTATEGLQKRRCLATLAAFWSPQRVEHYEWHDYSRALLERLAKSASKHPCWSAFVQVLNLAFFKRNIDSFNDARVPKLNEQGAKADPKPNRSDVAILARDLDFIEKRQDNETTYDEQDIDNWIQLRCEQVKINTRGGKSMDLLVHSRLQHYCLKKDRHGVLVLLDSSAAAKMLQKKKQAMQEEEIRQSALAKLQARNNKRPIPDQGGAKSSAQPDLASAKRSCLGLQSEDEDEGEGEEEEEEGEDHTHDDDEGGDDDGSNDSDGNEGSEDDISSTPSPQAAGSRYQRPTVTSEDEDEDEEGENKNEDEDDSDGSGSHEDSSDLPDSSSGIDADTDASSLPGSSSGATSPSPSCCDAWGYEAPSDCDPRMRQAIECAQHRHKHIKEIGQNNRILCDSMLGWVQHAKPAIDGIDYMECDAESLQEELDKDCSMQFKMPLLIKEDFRDKRNYTEQDFVERMKIVLVDGTLDVISPFDKEPRQRLTSQDLKHIVDKQKPGINALSMADFIGAYPPALMTLRRFEWLQDMLHALRVSEDKIAGKAIDVAECIRFSLFACKYAYSGPHMDALCGTWIRPVSGAPKLWMFISGTSMTAPDWDDFKSLAHNWVPRPGLVRYLFVGKGTSFIMPPNLQIIHAVGTIGTSIVAGGMFWDRLSIIPTLRNLNYITEHQNTTNEPRQLDLHRVITQMKTVVHKQAPKLHSDKVYQENLACFYSFTCHCRGSCRQETCNCIRDGRRCTRNCLHHCAKDHMPCFEE